MSKFENILVYTFLIWLIFLLPATILISKIADAGEHSIAIKILFIYSLIGIIDLILIGNLNGSDEE